jgi:hypothetical protein
MKKVYKLVAVASLSLMTIGAIAQSAKNIPITGHHFEKNTKFSGAKSNLKKPQAGPNTIIINYDSADAAVWQSVSTTYYNNQGQLMNYYYSYPTDTVGGNNNLINYVGVAFDSLVDAYNQNTADYAGMGVLVDTIIIPIVHVNHSGLVDTLDVQMFACNEHGYPTNTLLKDYKVIGKKISDTNSNALIGTALVPINTPVTSPGGKFYIQATYRGAKIDSCWFIYGFGGFNGSCAGGTYTLADSTNFSTIKFTTASKKASQFTANSFEFWDNMNSGSTTPWGFLPDSTGGGVFIPCNGGTTFVAGDGDNYFEDVNIFAQVTYISTVGINELSTNGFNVSQNQPNPFNQATQINYNLTKSSDVVFSVYDLTGRKIITNTYNEVAPGQHMISLNANQFTAGVYFYSFNVNGKVVTKKMVITQ